MSQLQSLFSAQAKTMSVAVTASASASTALPSGGDSIRIYNEGPNTAFVSIGEGAQTATLPATSGASAVATCTVVGAGIDAVFSIASLPGGTPLNISAICRAAGTATLDVSVGEGC